MTISFPPDGLITLMVHKRDTVPHCQCNVAQLTVFLENKGKFSFLGEEKKKIHVCNSKAFFSGT